MKNLINLIQAGRSNKSSDKFGQLGKGSIKLIAVVFFILSTFVGYSTTYYVSSSTGSDSNSGTSENSAWRSLEKVNSFTPKAGDQILFKKGDEWVGTLQVNGSGTSGSPIVYGAYGTGEKPKFYGSEVITGWTKHSGNIYKAKVGSSVSQLFVNGVRVTVARYPDNGYFYIDNVNSQTSFTCDDLNSGIDYSGALCHVRNYLWSMDEEIVSSSSSKTLNLGGDPYGTMVQGNPFFLNNKLEFLTQAGEWYFDEGTNTVFLWTPKGDSPSNYEVRGSSVENSVYINGKDYIVINNLNILQSKSHTVYARSSDYLTISNCNVEDADGYGIYGVSCLNAVIDSNTLTGSIGDGVYLNNENKSNQGPVTITNNTIKDVSKFSDIGVAGMYYGNSIFTKANDAVIRYNRILDAGYIGIQFYGQNSIVEYNFVDGYCQTLTDGGGIYTWVGQTNNAPRPVNSKGSVIRKNIVINGNGDGTGYKEIYNNDAGTYGIYLDEASEGVLVEGNTVAKSSGHALFYHQTIDIVSKNNILFDNPKGFREKHNKYFSKGNQFVGNVVCNIETTTDWYNDTPLSSQMATLNPSTSEAVLDNNVYVDRHRTNVFRDLNTFTFVNFSSWQELGEDGNSKLINAKLSIGETEQLFYNDTKQNKTFNLGTTVYKDIYGKEVTGKLVLEPFTSAILVKTTKTAQVNQAPVINNQVFSVAAPLKANDLIGQVIASDPDAGQVLNYSIAQGNEKGLFVINTSTGELYTTTEVSTTSDQTYNLVVEVVDNSTSPLTAGAEITITIIGAVVEEPKVDVTSPVISAFGVPSESVSLSVPVFSFEASDNVSVAGYLLTETSQEPSLEDAGWTSTSPEEYTFSSAGTYKLYAWVKDSAGNISEPFVVTVTVILPDLSPVYSEYLFEEGAGNDVIDSEGSNDGVLVNEAVRTSGASGMGLQFSGSGHVSLGECFGENVQEEVTMSAWLKPATSSSGYQGIVMHGGPNTDSYALYIYPNTKTIGFKTSGTTSSWFSAGGVEELWDGNWHHVAVTYNGSEKVIYVDNVAVATISATGSIDSGYGYNLLIGAGRDEEVPTLLYEGMLDEVRIYNYALTVSAIGDLYHPVNRELNKIATEEEVTICEGSEYMGWTEAGEYERTLQRILASTSGADSVVTTTLYVTPGYTVTETATVCEGETYTFGGQTLTESGEYTEVFSAQSGCDSTVVLTLTVNPVSNTVEDVAIVEGESYNGWTETGVYERTLVSATGCDSVVVTNLKVYATVVTEEEVTICEGETYKDWTETGSYERVLQSVSGSDSIVVTSLTVNPVYNVIETVSVCEGETYTFGSQTLTESGEYTEVFSAQTGCDSTVVLTLTVNSISNTVEDVAIAEGESYNGWIEAGVYERTLVSATGCDSVVVTNLKVYATVVTEEEVTICEGESYNGWIATGSYERVLTSVSGSDSIVVTRLTVNLAYHVTEAASVCEGETYFFGGKALGKSGEYTEVFETQTGCDSTVVLTLTVNPVSNTVEDVAIVEGESYNGWTEAGVYERTLVSATGCDSVVVTNLSVEQGEVQTIVLEEGWNIISSYLIPSDDNVESVMEPLRNNGSLVVVEDEGSNTYEQLDPATGWVNNIGDIKKTEGYKIRVNSSTSFEIKGKKVQLPLTIELERGWNLVSFPLSESVDAMQVVQSLIDSGILNKVQDEKGRSIEKWRSRWINDIGNFNPGEGYMFYAKKSGSFTIYETTKKSAQLYTENAKSDYFHVDYEGNGVDHMNINIGELDEALLSVGDEIAVFDNNVCVGAIKLTEQNFDMDAVGIPASASEYNMNNGFAQGNSIQLRIWKNDTNEEFELPTEVVEGEMVFNRQGSVFVAILNATTNIGEIDELSFDVDIYPNPASNNVNIRFSEMPDFGTTVSILDITGKQVMSDEVTASQEVFDISNLPSGVYFVRAEFDKKFSTHKLIKQ
ncbi:Por secretion system C-terminal sorting domain-containing protein [Mariniphaga anaerophila]|uniref:Por secretion system C-terminal sorting domain-containing protein n=1 Tax=Mariniphaga anaerophila TaxID=1484053 RepID=A0A1M5BPA5_9BACT|nr:LamG-like jellyroll fold domain-containing protein [Mariniphaga anaerophila]SHF44052.1 Por secretion system C-terminal sorting domain-containing protein [Mariniphaga anaerophila]